MPIAIACLRLLTGCLDFPECSVPSLNLCISVSMICFGVPLTGMLSLLDDPEPDAAAIRDEQRLIVLGREREARGRTVADRIGPRALHDDVVRRDRFDHDQLSAGIQIRGR